MEPDFWEQPGAIWRRSEAQAKGKGEEREMILDFSPKQDKVFQALTVQQSLL